MVDSGETYGGLMMGLRVDFGETYGGFWGDLGGILGES
jgi:hypothetical protein